MKFSLKCDIYKAIVLIATRLTKIYLMDDSKSVLYFYDLDLIFKVKSQNNDVKFPLKMRYFLLIDGYSSDLHGYIIVTG